MDQYFLSLLKKLFYLKIDYGYFFYTLPGGLYDGNDIIGSFEKELFSFFNFKWFFFIFSTNFILSSKL